MQTSIDEVREALDAWHRVIAVNLNGVFYCNHAAVSHMERNSYGANCQCRFDRQQGGHAKAAAYSASKAAVIGFTKSLGKELAQTESA